MGFLRIKFDDINESFIDFHSEFIITRFNQTKKLKPTEKEAIEFFFDHFGELIKEARAAKTGELYIVFDNGTELVVEDGPYENWHFTQINKSNKNHIFIHGGVGRTVY